MSCFLHEGHNRPRFRARAETFLVLINGSNWPDFKRGDRNWLGLFVRAKNGVFFGVGIDLLSFWTGGRNWLGFFILAENHLVLVWRSNLTSFLCEWSKLTWFRCRDRNWLRFGVGVENDLVFIFGSKLPWFQHGDRNWLVFSAAIGVDLVYVGDWTWLDIYIGISMDLISVCGVEVDLVLV